MARPMSAQHAVRLMKKNIPSETPDWKTRKEKKE
jgi:hypothetical protein